MSPRRLTLLDVMILVAATAPALLLYREFERSLPALTYILPGEHGPSRIEPWALILGVVPSLAVYSLALPPLRFLGPRPRPRRTWLAPGMTAGLATAFAFGIVLAEVALDRPMLDRVHFGQTGPVGLVGGLTIRMVGMKDLVGPGLAFVWALLGMGGAWREEPDWLDQAGRAIGLVWITLGLASWIFGLCN